MISISTQPNSICFSGNPLPVQITCAAADGSPFAWYGVRTTLHITGPDFTPFVAGDTLVLTVSEPEFGPTTSTTFTFATTPSTPTQLPANLGDYPNLISYWQAIAAIIQAQPVARNLRITALSVVDGYDLVAEALGAESDWALTWSSNQATATTNVAAGTNLPATYRVKAELWWERSTGAYQRLALLEGLPLGDSTLYFDCSAALHAALESILPNTPPASNLSTPLAWNVVRRYYLRIYESTATVGSPYTQVVETQLAELVYGGISQTDHAGQDYFSAISATNSLLTLRPYRRTVHRDQPEWITWYNYTPAAVIPAIEVTYHYADGTSAVQQVLTQHEVSIASHRIAIIPVGPSILDAVASVACVGYTVVVVEIDGATVTPLSPAITYQLIDDYTLEVRTLVYLNPLGGLEVLRCVGDVNLGLEIERELYEGSIAPTFTAATRQRGQYHAEWDQVYDYHTGYLSREEAIALQGLLVFGRVWEITPTGTTPLLLAGDQFSITSTRENLHSYRLPLRRALRDKFIPLPAQLLAGGNYLVDDEGSPLADDEGAILFEG